MPLSILHRLRVWRRRRRYRPGAVLTSFLAPDVRRDVEIIDTSNIEAGVLTVRTRTWNVLHVIRGMATQPPFGDVRTVEIKDLWEWTGERWGGPVPADADRAVP